MSERQGKTHVRWQDIADIADDIFNVWVGHPELRWAQQAWQMLQEAELTAFRNEIDYHTVLCRLLVLGGIYRDFCKSAFDEVLPSEEPYSQMAEGLELDSFILGRLYERLSDARKDGDVTLFDALEMIVESQRTLVVSALIEGFGSDNRLYVSLRDSTIDLDELDEAYSTDSRRGYMWVTEGCYSLR